MCNIRNNQQPSSHRQTTPRQRPFLSRDCSIISYIGRPDNENHYTDDRLNNHYQLKNSTWWTTEATLLQEYRSDDRDCSICSPRVTSCC